MEWCRNWKCKILYCKTCISIFQNKCKKDRFIDKYKDFNFKNNKLIFKTLILEVVPNKKIDETLKKFYNDFKALGAGKINFQKKITSNFININR